MTDRDEAVSRRYRELAREEPPAALDAAILAAASGVARPRARSLWPAAISIAAVLVLGIGISMRMLVEEPGVETSMPRSSSSAEYPAPQAAEAPAEERAQPRLEDAPSKPLQKRAAPPSRAAAPPAPVPAPAQDAVAPSTAGSAATPPPAAQAAAETTAEAAPRAKLRAEAPAAPMAARDERVAELERIARLRSEGRHAEADKALEEFRRAHPDYRIAEAMWERVRPR